MSSELLNNKLAKGGSNINSKIDILTEITNDSNIIYIPNKEHLSLLVNDDKLMDKLSIDTTTSAHINEELATSFILLPIFEFILKEIKRFIKHITEHRNKRSTEDKDKLMTEIETAIKANKSEGNFIDDLDNIRREKNMSKLELSKYARMDASYLNKLLNNKLDENSDIGRDTLIKLCLALKLNLIETNNILVKAGYILIGKNERDTVLCVCIENMVGVIETETQLYNRGLKILTKKD